ncbi:neoverrucotoxin subunit alpha-like isoform 2-T2 [Symphorus nematophorus]
MVNTYRLHGALTVTKKVLEKINRNDLAQNLSDTSSEPQGAQSLVQEFRGILGSWQSAQTELDTSSLRELDLKDSGMKLQYVRLQTPGYTLETLRVEPVGVQSRQDLRNYSCELTFDTNTISREIELSNNNRTVTNMCRRQPYPDHPDRFDVRPPQLLCKHALTGRCYWEVEWTGRVDIAVSYRGIRRKGDSNDREFGHNHQSWCLSSCDGSIGGYLVRHNNRESSILPASSSSSGPSFHSSDPHRVGVYVDWPAGILSFYSVSSNTLIHLYTFNTKFTEPLYPGFGLGFGEWFVLDTVTLCSL